MTLYYRSKFGYVTINSALTTQQQPAIPWGPGSVITHTYIYTSSSTLSGTRHISYQYVALSRERIRERMGITKDTWYKYRVCIVLLRTCHHRNLLVPLSTNMILVRVGKKNQVRPWVCWVSLSRKNSFTWRQKYKNTPPPTPPTTNNTSNIIFNLTA